MKKLAKNVGILSAAVAFGAGAALAAPLAGAQSSLPGGAPTTEPCGETVVTSSGLEAAGWGTPDDETPAEIAAVEDAPEEVGAAAVVFGEQTANQPAVSLYRDAGRMPLPEVIGEDGAALFSYDYTTSGQAPSLQIRLNDATLAETEKGAGGYDIGFASIYWSPAAGESDWQSAEPADSGEFRATRALVGEDGKTIPRHTAMSLEQLVELNPDAVVMEYGIQKSRENVAEDVAIDNFTFGCQTTDFELEPAAQPEDPGFLGSLTGILNGVTGSLD